MQNKNKLILKVSCAVIGIALAGIGTSFAMAYFTDSVEINNDFTIGSVGIKVTEDNFDPDSTHNILFGKNIAKDPRAQNIGNVDEYIKLEVYMPVENNVSWVDKNNTFHEGTENTYVDVFKYNVDLDKWAQLEEEVIDDSLKEDNGYSYRIYSYICKEPISPDKYTPYLFKTITMNNITQGQINGNSYDVPIKGYAIQASGFTGDSILEELTHAKTEDWVSEPDENP